MIASFKQAYQSVTGKAPDQTVTDDCKLTVHFPEVKHRHNDDGTVTFPIKSQATDPFDAVLTEIREINRKKRADYATGQDPWSNFKDSGRQVNQSAGTAVEILIATKQSRLRQLLGSGRQPQNEGTRDSLLDRAVYSIIALAMYDEGLYLDGSTEEEATGQESGG